MEYYINHNIYKSDEGLTLSEITLKLPIYIEKIILNNKGNKYDFEENKISNYLIEILIDYSFISEIENHYNLIPNSNYSFYSLDSKCFLEEFKKIKYEVGIFEVPYFHGAIKHDYSVQSVYVLKENSYKTPNPNDSFIFEQNPSYKQRKVLDYGFLRINQKRIMEKEIYSLSHKIFSTCEKCLLPVFIGGDHSITYSILCGLRDSNPNEKIRLVNLDAHSDLGYFDKEIFNGNVINAISTIDNVEVINFGLRGPITYNEAKNIKSKLKVFTDIDKMLNYLYLDKTVKTYVSIDLDVFDPSIISAVTFPVSGGIDIEDYDRLLEGLKELNIIGVDVVEYNVTFDYNSQNASTINLIIYKIIKMLQSIR